MNAIENSESPVFRSIMNRCDRDHLIRTMAEKERALIAEYYDEDGNLLHRPRTRQRARLASCVASIQEYEASEIHALPDEVLLLVFSRMQSAELLPLRLVCPRWNQLILDPAVWRWRKISDESPFDDWRTASSILYNAPTLGTVELPDCRFSEGAKRLMAALLEGRCQVRSLSCLLVLRVREDVHPALFRRLQPCLVDLDVQLARSSYVSSTGMVAIKRHLASMLESLDNSPLQRLALRSYGLHSFDLTLEDFEFKKLEALQEVSLDGRVLALDLQRNLVTLTRSTLRRVTCSSDLLPSLAQCPNLVAVTVTRYSGLDALYDLKALESVTLNIDRLHDIRFVDSYLSAARKGCRLPRSVGVVGDTSVNFLLGLQEANLRKITTLRLNLNSYEIGAIACTLKCLPSLQVLHIPSCTISSPSWEAVNLGTLNEVVLYGYVRSRSEAVTTIKARWPQVTCRLFPLIGSRHRDFLLL